MAPWVNGWALPQMYAGPPGQGAEDAAYANAITMEFLTVTNTPFIGASADLAKCFDELQRELVYAILRIAGMPVNILNA